MKMAEFHTRVGGRVLCVGASALKCEEPHTPCDADDPAAIAWIVFVSELTPGGWQQVMGYDAAETREDAERDFAEARQNALLDRVPHYKELPLADSIWMLVCDGEDAYNRFDVFLSLSPLSLDDIAGKARACYDDLTYYRVDPEPERFKKIIDAYNFEGGLCFIDASAHLGRTAPAGEDGEPLLDETGEGEVLANIMILPEEFGGSDYFKAYYNRPNFVVWREDGNRVTVIQTVSKDFPSTRK